MIVKYFEDTDTIYVEFNRNVVVETRDLDENTLVDYDEKGRLVGITIEHAKRVADVSDFSFQHVLPD